MEELKTILYVATPIVGVIASILFTKFQTKQNTKDLEDHKEEISQLKDKCNTMMEEKTARKEFVHVEIFNERMRHLEGDVGDIKSQTSQILNLMIKDKACI